MWQPRGLDYSLYTVLSRHHSRANDFSLSFFSRQENAAAGDLSSFAGSATIAAGPADDAVSQSTGPALLTEMVVEEERGESEAEGDAIDLSVRCQKSRVCTSQSAILTLHHQKDHKAAGLPLFQNGIGMGDGVRKNIVAGMSRSYLPKAMEPSVAEDLTQIHKRQAQSEEEQGEVVKFQEEMQLQQGRQGCLPTQRRHQHQRQMQQAQLHPQKGQERQEQDHHQPQHHESHLPPYFGHMSSRLRSADDVTGGDTAREPHRRTCVDMKREYTTRLGDGQLSISEPLEKSGEATACSSSSFSPLLCPPRLAEPFCSSERHAAESITTAAAMFCPTEGSPCGVAEKTRTDSSLPSAAADVPPSVVAITSTASTTSESAAKETNTEPLIRLPSAPVVPSFRVLILFGSTSGVSAAVAFSIFHTFVHRLLSSFNRVQGGGYSADRSTTYSLGLGSPVAAMTAQQTSLSLRLDSASSEEAFATSTLAAASSSSPRNGAGVVCPAFSTSEDAPADSNEEKDSQEDSAARQSKGDNNTFVDAEELFLNCQSQEKMTNTSSLPSTSRRGLSGKTFSDTNNYTHHETSTGKVSGGGLKNKTTHPQRHGLKQPRQRQRRQQEVVGGRSQGQSQADCNEMPQKVKEICSQRQWQESQQRSSAQRQKQQQDEQHVFPQNAAGLRRKSNCMEESQSLTEAGARCAFPGGPELILEKREAAAQAAEVASMGLKAAAAIASAALKTGEQRDAARRAAAATSAERHHYKEEPKTWFMDEIQIGRVGVYIQSMRYFTFEDLLEFAEESRVASSAGTATAAAAREPAAACALGRMSCRRGVATDSAAFSFPGAIDTDAGADAERASGRLCGNSRADSAVVNDLQNDFHDSAFVRSSDCGVSLYATAKPAAAGASRTSGDDDLSSTPHTLILYCLSTHMGGAPPDSAASFYSEVLEAADDFRVNRGSLRGCCVAGVGCGSTDYPQSTYCRPARQLMTPLHRLGARVLMQEPLLLLTDTSAAATTEMKLAKWRQQLVQQVERLLQASDEKDVQQLLQDAKKGAFFPRQKQNQQRHRQQLQQPHRSQWPEGDHEACKDTAGACSATSTEVAEPKEVGNSRLQQRHAVAVSNVVSNKNGIVSQNTLQGFLSMTDSSYVSGSDEQSDDTYDADDGDDDDDDDNSSSLAGEASFAKDKRVNPSSKRRMLTFTGVGSNICGGSGNDDLEDVVGAEIFTEDGAKLDSENNNSLQMKRLQADKSRVTQRRERGQLYGKQADQASYSHKTDKRERHHGASEHASAGEVKKRRQQRRESKRETERTPEKMIKPRHAEQLSKEGYRLIGSHSAVKLCRWTKSHLRGRGGCYKHTFYGITSSQCMEMTPSLACANKCIFCWRHHKNPVGTSWRWQMDDAGFVVNEAITQHFKAIKELKGMAEVKQDRLDAARGNIRHCALSLVGEPIMYPRIDALVKLLHEKCISTFLVTNAQFPDALASLPPVTQLYLSVDAASPGDLKALDQPLFSDYWGRFIKCMEILRSKRQRTVYRLTLVAGYNMPDLATLGQNQSEARSGAHQAGRQQGGIIAHLSSDEGQPFHACHSPLTERGTLGMADRRAHGSTCPSACPSGDAAAGLTMSPVSSVRTSSSPMVVPTTSVSATFKSRQDVETEDCSRTVECDRAQHFTGRSAIDYAALVLKGLPDFIEVKAVTYAGTSKHSKITMKNIPWHDQVIAFCKDLCAALPKGAYELACAHRHSCCVLIAKTEYKKNGQWHTWINYDRFHELAATGRADFAGTDYCAPTPDWAIFGHAAAGFSPFEARIYTKGKQKRLQASVATAEICQA